MQDTSTLENSRLDLAAGPLPVPVHAGELKRMPEFSAFGSLDFFKAAQRMAQMLCSSSIVPETYRGESHLGDCVIALELANRIGASVLAVMQNLYLVYGRPAWSSQFLISCLNASGKFSPLRYRMSGKGEEYGCTAWAKDKADGEVLEGPQVTISMAKAEGWFDRKGSKWQTMPELMLRYRAATLFARLFAPELSMGIMSDQEIVDIAPIVTDPVARAKPVPDNKPQFALEADAPASQGETPSEPEKPSTSQAKAERRPAKPVVPPMDVDRQEGRLQSELAGIVTGAGYTFDQLVDWCEASAFVPEFSKYPSFADVPDSVCRKLLNAKTGLLTALKRVQGNQP